MNDNTVRINSQVSEAYLNIHLSDEQLRQLAIYVAEQLLKKETQSE